MSSPILTSPPSTTVVTVEAFLRESCAKLPKTYRRLRSHRKCAATIPSIARDEGSETEVSATIPLTHARKRCRTLLQPLDNRSSIPEIKRSITASHITSRLATVVHLPHIDPTQDMRQPRNEEVGLRHPLDFGPIHDLDFPLLRRPQRSRQWKLLRAQDVDLPKLPLFNHSSPKTAATGVRHKPISHWRTFEPIRASKPPTTALKNSNVMTSRQGVRPLKFVSWEKHEEGLLGLRACRLR
jgi:hypothetical protein